MSKKKKTKKKDTWKLVGEREPDSEFAEDILRSVKNGNSLSDALSGPLKHSQLEDELIEDIPVFIDWSGF